jgi:hypothetical protein
MLMPFDPIDTTDILGKVTTAVVHDPPPVYLPGEEPDPHTNPIKLQNCGRLRYGTFSDGSMGWYHWYCKCYRKCADCLAARAVEYAGYAHWTQVNYGGIKLVRFADGHEKTVAYLCERLGGENYIRMPQEDGVVILLSKDEKLLENETKAMTSEQEYTTIEEINDIDWQTLTKTPWHKYLTGGLGKPVPSSNKTDSVVAKITDFNCNATVSQHVEAFTEAVIATPETPETIDDVPVLMNKRTDAYIEALCRRGCKVTNVHGIIRRLEIVRIVVPNNSNTIKWLVIPNDKTVDYNTLVHNYASFDSAVAQELKTIEQRGLDKE